MSESADVLALLRAALGDRVDTTEAARHEARADKSGHAASGVPLAVVHARSIADVQATLRIATETRTPVVVRGAGTGLAGAANAGEGEIALSMRAMDRILEVRPDDLLAVVEPGILNGDLDTALAEFGLWWAPDPASRAISTVGGNIATGAGGLLCAKYGVVRDAVLGVDLVLADGRLLHLGHRTVKGVTGLDLTSLVIGSEGTLGVVVGATLKLRRLVPGDVCTVAATFPDVRTAAEASAAVTASGVQPAIMELMDAASLAAVHALLSLDTPTPGAAQLTIQTDGPAAAAEADAIAATLRAAGGTVVVSHDRAEGERLLAIRRSMHPAMETLGTTLIEDVSVPRSALPAMFDEIARVERTYGVTIPTVAHAGDGNLHPNFIFDFDELGRPAKSWCRPRSGRPRTISSAPPCASVARSPASTASECSNAAGSSTSSATTSGSCSGRSRGVFDPLGILNPGKVFDR